VAGATDGGQPIVLRLVVEPGDPPAGTVEVEGRAPPHPFCGWLELMAAIAAVRRADPG
jgi:hypothetical protein